VRRSLGTRAALGAALALVLAGCASTSECVPPAGLTPATPAEAAAGGLAEGAQVRWGGVLVETRNLRDRTELEVVGYPLDDCGRPRTGASPLGRFVIVHPGYLETAEYPAGRAVTATGRFSGVRSGRVGEAAQSLPLIESYKPRLWAEDRGRTYRGYGGPWFNIGIGGGSGGIGGGVGVTF
jgi:outer membrane lipoprotein